MIYQIDWFWWIFQFINLYQNTWICLRNHQKIKHIPYRFPKKWISHEENNKSSSANLRIRWSHFLIDFLLTHFRKKTGTRTALNLQNASCAIFVDHNVGHCPMAKWSQDGSMTLAHPHAMYICIYVYVCDYVYIYIMIYYDFMWISCEKMVGRDPWFKTKLWFLREYVLLCPTKPPETPHIERLWRRYNSFAESHSLSVWLIVKNLWWNAILGANMTGWLLSPHPTRFCELGIILQLGGKWNLRKASGYLLHFAVVVRWSI